MEKNVINTERLFIDMERLIQINIAEDICDVINSQIRILSGLKQTQDQREYIANLYQAVLNVVRSFNEERIVIERGK